MLTYCCASLLDFFPKKGVNPPQATHESEIKQMEAHVLLIIRDVKIQRHHHNEKVEKKNQQQQQTNNDNNRFNKQNNNFARASHYFVHFFVITARLISENAYFRVLWRT